MDSTNPHLSSSPPPPSEEIVRNLATFLHKDPNDYIQVREDDQHYYVDIGPSNAVDQIYRPLHTRVNNIKDKFDSSIRALLTQMLADQKTDNNEAVHATPSKTRASKRPVPKSSSVNKVIISRSKRSSGDRNKNSTASTSKDTISSERGKTLFSGSKAQTTDDSISPDTIAENISNLQQNALHLMSELSIDPNTTAPSTSSSFVASTTTNKKKKNKKKATSSLKKPFIAIEESLVEHGPIIIQESTDNLLTASTGMSTRSRTRQANNNNILVNSAAKTVTKSRKNDAGLVEKLLVSTSASKDSHKNKCLVTASPKSLNKLNGGQLKTNRRRSKSATNLNFTPSKPNLVDLSASGLKKAGSASKIIATTSATSSSKGSSNNFTPNRRACAAAPSPTLPSTPSSILAATARRNEIELSRQERLILSEDKRKKAEEKKKAILDSRTNALKNAREVRMGKIAQNKKQIDEEKENKLKALGNVGHVVTQSAGPSAPMTKAAARIAQRRAKLLQLEQEEQKANEAAMAEAQSATTSMEKVAPTKTNKPVAKNKSKTKGGGKKQQQVKPDIEVVPESMEVNDQHHYEHLQDVGSASVMAPIAKTSGINGKINETFTGALNPSYTDVPASCSTFNTAPGPSGLVPPVINNDSTFVRPDSLAPVTPGKATTTATSFNLSKSILSKLNDTNNYEMTPPQPERSYDHNYDISQYIDSDDEEQQVAQEEARCGKRVPRWCQGKRFVTQLHNQFSMPADQLAEWTKRIFPKPLLPVPLDLMGLSVREKYVNRSSSVNWKTAAEIERKLKAEEDNEQNDGNDN